MKKLMFNRNYRNLWLSQFISMIGNWAMFAALPFFVFKLTGSVLATGIMFMVEVLPSVVLGSIAGVFVDRWNRKWTMIWSSVLRGLFLLPLVFVSRIEDVWIVYLVAFVGASINQFFNPANNALLPQLVSKKELITANSLDSLGENAARIIGPAIGGAMLNIFNLSGVVVMNAGAFFIAGFFIFFIRTKDENGKSSGQEEKNRCEVNGCPF